MNDRKKPQSRLLTKIMQASSLFIGVGLLGLYLTINIPALQITGLIALFAVIACTGCIGLIVYSTIYVIEKIREDRK